MAHDSNCGTVDESWNNKKSGNFNLTFAAKNLLPKMNAIAATTYILRNP